MPITDENTMTNAGWVVHDGLPPGFYYTSAQRPHLHLTCALINDIHGNPQLAGPWNVAYLAYTDINGTATVIFRRNTVALPGIDNHAAIANLPATLQLAATNAYGLR